MPTSIMRSWWSSGARGPCKVRILHAHLSEEFAGSERYCASLANAQAKLGHTVAVIVRQSKVTGRWRREAGTADVITVPWWMPSILERWVIRKMISGFGPEVVHTHLGRANMRAGGVARRMKLPWVATLHLRWKGKEVMGADGVVCIAAWQKGEIPADYKGLVDVVWNWLPGRVGKLVVNDELRKRWGAGPQTVVFGSVGRLHGQKGMDVLIKAFKQAFEASDDVRLVIVGGGEQERELKALAGDRRVVFEGYVEDVEPYYRAFDGYVSAARYEPFGLTILEAMDAGNVLVCSKTEGPSEFLKGYDVHWVEKGQTHSLAAALRQVFAGGRRKVSYDMKPFTAGRAVGEVVAFYEKVRAAC